MERKAAHNAASSSTDRPATNAARTARFTCSLSKHEEAFPNQPAFAQGSSPLVS